MAVQNLTILQDEQARQRGIGFQPVQSVQTASDQNGLRGGFRFDRGWRDHRGGYHVAFGGQARARVNDVVAHLTTLHPASAVGGRTGHAATPLQEQHLNVSTVAVEGFVHADFPRTAVQQGAAQGDVPAAVHQRGADLPQQARHGLVRGPAFGDPTEIQVDARGQLDGACGRIPLDGGQCGNILRRGILRRGVRSLQTSVQSRETLHSSLKRREVAVVAGLQHRVQHRGRDQAVCEFLCSMGGLEHVPQIVADVCGLVNRLVQP